MFNNDNNAENAAIKLEQYLKAWITDKKTSNEFGIYYVSCNGMISGFLKPELIEAILPRSWLRMNTLHQLRWELDRLLNEKQLSPEAYQSSYNRLDGISRQSPESCLTSSQPNTQLHAKHPIFDELNGQLELLYELKNAVLNNGGIVHSLINRLIEEYVVFRDQLCHQQPQAQEKALASYRHKNKGRHLVHTYQGVFLKCYACCPSRPFQFVTSDRPDDVIDAPAIEQTIHLLSAELKLTAVTPSQLICLTYRGTHYIALASLAVPGVDLEDALYHDANVLTQLDRESVSSTIVMSLLTRPGDGKWDNYRILNTQEKNKPFISVDNDLSFVKPYYFNKRKNRYFLRIRQLLYGVEAWMQAALANDVSEHLQSLVPEKIIIDLLNGLVKYNRACEKLLGYLKQEEPELLTIHLLQLQAKFIPGTITRLYQQLCLLQTLVQKSPHIRHDDLLASMDAATQHAYTVLRKTSAIHDFSSYQEFLQRIDTCPVDEALVKTAQQEVAENEQDYVTQRTATLITEAEHWLATLDFSHLAIERQQSILNKLSLHDGIDWQQITLRSCQALTDDTFALLLSNHPNLTQLTLLHCHHVTLSGFKKQRHHLPHLTVQLEGCHHLADAKAWYELWSLGVNTLMLPLPNTQWLVIKRNDVDPKALYHAQVAQAKTVYEFLIKIGAITQSFDYLMTSVRHASAEDPWVQFTIEHYVQHLLNKNSQRSDYANTYQSLGDPLRALFERTIQKKLPAKRQENNNNDTCLTATAVLRYIQLLPTRDNTRPWAQSRRGEWLHLLDTITLPDEGSLQGIVTVYLTSPTLDERRLAPVIVEDLIKRNILDKSGAITQAAFDEKSTNHVVVAIQYQGHCVHIKFFPGEPCKELMALEFANRLWGYGIAPSECMLWHSGKYFYPVLFSRTVSDQSLEDAPEVLEKLNPQHFSELFLLNLLLDPEDGHARNWYVDKTMSEGHQEGMYVESIDNDRIFMPAFKEDGKIGIKCILYCTDQMKMGIHPKVRALILALDRKAFLETWLLKTKEACDGYQKIFADHIVPFFQKKGLFFDDERKRSLTMLLLRPGTISRLYQRLRKIQGVLQQTEKITHLELLSHIHYELAHYYEGYLKQALSTLDRFQHATQGQYLDKKSSVSLKEFLCHSRGELPAENNYKAMANQDIQNALQELEKLKAADIQKALAQLQQGSIQGFIELNDIVLQEEVLDRIVSSTLLPAKTQRDLFTVLQKNKRHNTLHFRAWLELTDAQLLQLLKTNKDLHTLRVPGCTQLTEAGLSQIAVYKNIKILNISALPNITALVFDKQTSLNNVLRLSMRGWINQPSEGSRSRLQKLVLVAPELQELNLRDNSALIDLELHCPKLKKLDIRGCVGLSQKSLQELRDIFSSALLIAELEQYPKTTKNGTNNNALFMSVYHKNLEMVRYLTTHQSLLDEQDFLGNTALIVAINHHFDDISKYLIDHGASLIIKNKRDKNERDKNALLIAVGANNCEIAKYLIEHKSPLDEQDRDGNTALMLAIGYYYNDISKYLIDHGASLIIKNKSGENALLRAVNRNNFEMVNYLIDHKSPLDEQDSDGNTALMLAIAYYHNDISKYLIDHAASLIIKNKRGENALLRAVNCNNFEMVNYLIDHKSPLDEQDSDGNTALMLAISYQCNDISKYLIDHGASLIIKNKRGENALLRAVNCNNFEIVKYLIENKSPLNEQDSNGYTALMCAVLMANMSIIKHLIDHNASLTIRSETGATALSIASARQAFLYCLGAYPYIRFHLAQQVRQSRIQSVLILRLALHMGYVPDLEQQRNIIQHADLQQIAKKIVQYSIDNGLNVTRQVALVEPEDLLPSSLQELNNNNSYHNYVFRFFHKNGDGLFDKVRRYHEASMSESEISGATMKEMRLQLNIKPF